MHKHDFQTISKWLLGWDYLETHKDDTTPKLGVNFPLKQFGFRTHKNDTIPKQQKYVCKREGCFRTHKNDTTPKLYNNYATKELGFRTHKNDTTPKLRNKYEYKCIDIFGVEDPDRQWDNVQCNFFKIIKVELKGWTPDIIWTLPPCENSVWRIRFRGYTFVCKS